jgi:hypothetical protein
MMAVGKLAPIPKSRLSKQMATNDDAAANEDEVEEQIEEENVEKTARENETGAPAPFMSNKQIKTADDAVASREDVEEQAEESRIDKVALEDGMSTASAEEYIQGGRTHD